MSAILEKINDEEDEDLTEINEAAAFRTESVWIAGRFTAATTYLNVNT